MTTWSDVSVGHVAVPDISRLGNRQLAGRELTPEVGPQVAQPTSDALPLRRREAPMRGFAIPCSLFQLRWWFAVQAIYARSVGSTFAKPANDNALRGAR